MTGSELLHTARWARSGAIILLASVFIATVYLLYFGGNPAGRFFAKIKPGTRTDAVVPPDDPSRRSIPTPDGAKVDPAVLAPDHVRVRGTVVVVDSKGVEHRDEDGVLELVIWKDTGGMHQNVTVERGVFSVDLPSKVDISVNRAVLGGRHAHAPAERIPVREGIEFRVTWSAPTILRVVDAEGGFDLSAITVVASTWQPEGCVHPGTYQTQDLRVANGRSPLQLTSNAQGGLRHKRETLWIHSPGYAWGRVTVDYENATERRVELHRGGTIEVRVRGRLPKKPKAPHRRGRLEGEHDSDEPRLRLRKLPEKPDIESRIRDALEFYAQLSDADLGGRPRPTKAELRKMFQQPEWQEPHGELVLEVAAALNVPIVLKGVPPGTYVLAVEIGKYYSDSPLVVGETNTTVNVGRTQYATVYVEPPADRATVPLSGSFRLPPAWNEPQLSLEFEPIDLPGKTSRTERSLKLSEMARDSATSGLYRWDAGLVVPGRYRVTCHTLAMKWVVDTGSSGNKAAEITVAVPVDASVRVLEEATGRWIEDVVVHWSGVRAEGVMDGLARWNAATRTYEFRIAAGRSQVQVLGKDYTTVGAQVFDIQPNTREFVVRVRRNCGVVLSLKYGKITIPWDESTRSKLSICTADGARASWGSGRSGENVVYLLVRKPGTYRVTVPDQPGFESIPPIDVRVKKGKFVQHVVQLRRRH